MESPYDLVLRMVCICLRVRASVWWRQGEHSMLPAHTTWHSLQASRLIVTFDEHVISNNFKFGVIYQKLGQVCLPTLPLAQPVAHPPPPSLNCHLPEHSLFPRSLGTAHGHPGRKWG